MRKLTGVMADPGRGSAAQAHDYGSIIRVEKLRRSIHSFTRKRFTVRIEGFPDSHARLVVGPSPTALRAIRRHDRE